MSQPSFQIQLPEKFSENFGEPIAGIFKLIETLVSNGKQNDYMQLLKFPDGINPESIVDLKYDNFFKQY